MGDLKIHILNRITYFKNFEYFVSYKWGFGKKIRWLVLRTLQF